MSYFDHFQTRLNLSDAEIQFLFLMKDLDLKQKAKYTDSKIRISGKLKMVNGREVEIIEEELDNAFNEKRCNQKGIKVFHKNIDGGFKVVVSKGDSEREGKITFKTVGEANDKVYEIYKAMNK